MDTPRHPAGTWIEQLVEFLRTQPAVSAVRIDPTAQRLEVATIGHVALDGLEDKLAGTIAAIEAELASKAAGTVPLG